MSEHEHGDNGEHTHTSEAAIGEEEGRDLIDFYVMSPWDAEITEEHDAMLARAEAYITTLDPEKQKFVAEQRQISINQVAHRDAERQAVRASLEASGGGALLEGRLTEDQIEVLRALGYEKYVLGSNQSDAGTVKEAANYVFDNGGVDLRGSPLIQRFFFFDETTPAGHNQHAVIEGPMGARAAGRFIIAVPYNGDKTEGAETFPALLEHEKRLPPGFIIEGMDDDAVSGKYVAAFVDVDGIYHGNRNFGKKIVPDFTP